MVKKVSFKVSKREKIGGSSASQLLRKRVVPGVIYGVGQEVVHVQGDFVTLEKLYYTAGEGTVVTLEVENGETSEVVIRGAEFHPVKGEITHIDFLRIDPKKKLQVTIQLKFIGEAPVVKKGGMVITNRFDVDVECLPKDLVHHFDLDLSKLVNLDDHILVSDLLVAEGMEIITEGETIIVHVEAPKSEKEIEAELSMPIEAPAIPGAEIDAAALEAKEKAKDKSEKDS